MTNKEIRAKVAEQVKPYKGRLFGYVLVFGILAGLISWVLNLIPIVGNFLGTVMVAICTLGLTFSIIKVYEGKGDGESPVSFFGNGFNNVIRYIKCGLWICLKLIIPIIVYVAGYVMLQIALKDVLEDVMARLYINPNGGAAIFEGLTVENPALLIAGVALIIVGFIWMFIKSLNYANSTYEIVSAEGEEVEAKELVERSFNHMQGNKMQWFKMLVYYLLFGICLGILCVIPILGWILAFIFGIILFYSQILSQWELHKDFSANGGASFGSSSEVNPSSNNGEDFIK